MTCQTEVQFNVMLDSWNIFDASIELSVNALNANKAHTFTYLKQLVHKNFFEFDKEFRNYKAIIIEKAAPNEEMFNSSSVDELSGELISKYQHNDAWAGLQMNRYIEILEMLDDGLELNQYEVETNDVCAWHSKISTEGRTFC